MLIFLFINFPGIFFFFIIFHPAILLLPLAKNINIWGRRPHCHLNTPSTHRKAFKSGCVIFKKKRGNGYFDLHPEFFTWDANLDPVQTMGDCDPWSFSNAVFVNGDPGRDRVSMATLFLMTISYFFTLDYVHNHKGFKPARPFMMVQSTPIRKCNIQGSEGGRDPETEGYRTGAVPSWLQCEDDIEEARRQRRPGRALDHQRHQRDGKIIAKEAAHHEEGPIWPTAVLFLY